ncbi:MAG: hypothetical protein H6R19_1062 [Proteobacteria bacterium]|nr:hypothetical protein [Pseudomonadota bacterium]
MEIIRVLWGSCLCLPIAVQAVCDLPERNLKADTTLEAGCVYHQSLVINRALTLDCQGAIFDGEDRLERGLVIDSQGEPLSGVVVKNCTFRHFAKTGVLVHWSLPNDQKIARYPDLAERRRRAPQNILLSKVRVEHNGVMGIVVDDYAQAVTLDQVSVLDNPGWGIYWDHDSRGHLLIDSEVRRNGGGSKLGKPGLSIDASSDNRVINTVFEGNRRSAIELYRNCWEFAASNPHSVPRETGANGNVIRGNSFIGEQVGVWVASRMSRDVSAMECGRPAYFEGKYVEDEARHNLIAGNRFSGVQGKGVVIEDDDNSVIDNAFERAAGAIEIGTRIRTKVLGRPVRGTVLRGNRADDGEDPVHFPRLE